METKNLQALFQETRNCWENLDKITKYLAEIKNLLASCSSDAKDPFSFHWIDGMNRRVRLDEDLSQRFTHLKHMWAQEFLAIMEKQLKRDKRKLGLFSGDFKRMYKQGEGVKNPETENKT
jgi:hypothetical protein